MHANARGGTGILWEVPDHGFKRSEYPVAEMRPQWARNPKNYQEITKIKTLFTILWLKFMEPEAGVVSD